MLIFIEAKQPFSLKSVINSHGWIQLAPFNSLPDDAGFSYIDRLDNGRLVRLIIQESPGGVSIDTGISISQEEQKEITDKVTWMLGLDQEFSKFYELIADEPHLMDARNLAQGRVLRSPTLFEDTVKTILTTNTVWGNTRKMVERLVQEYGYQMPEDSSLRSFPSAEQIANCNPETLRTIVRLGYRSSYVYELGKRISDGELDLENLKKSNLSTSELQNKLLSIKGVGKYAAANLLMLLGHYDYIPIDSWALKFVSQEFFSGAVVEPEDVESSFERFGKWKGLAFWLWK